MLEFIFFNPEPQRRFLDLAQEHGVSCTVNNSDDCYLVCLSEDTDDALLEELEQQYDTLMSLDQSLVEQTGPQDEQHTAGITVELKDGRCVYANIEPELLVRVLRCISTEELNHIVNAITEAVENPDESSLCQR